LKISKVNSTARLCKDSTTISKEVNLDDGILTARNIDLKRKVKFKPRKVSKTQIKDRPVFEGRMYTDFFGCFVNERYLHECDSILFGFDYTKTCSQREWMNLNKGIKR